MPGNSTQSVNDVICIKTKIFQAINSIHILNIFFFITSYFVAKRYSCFIFLLRLSLSIPSISFTNPCIHFNSNIPDLLLRERGKYRVWVMVFNVTFNNISATSWRGTCKFKYYQLISISIIFQILRFIPFYVIL